MAPHGSSDPPSSRGRSCLCKEGDSTSQRHGDGLLPYGRSPPRPRRGSRGDFGSWGPRPGGGRVQTARRCRLRGDLDVSPRLVSPCCCRCRSPWGWDFWDSLPRQPRPASSRRRDLGASSWRRVSVRSPERRGEYVPIRSRTRRRARDRCTVPTPSRPGWAIPGSRWAPPYGQKRHRRAVPHLVRLEGNDPDRIARPRVPIPSPLDVPSPWTRRVGGVSRDCAEPRGRTPRTDTRPETSVRDWPRTRAPTVRSTRIPPRPTERTPERTAEDRWGLDSPSETRCDRSVRTPTRTNVPVGDSERSWTKHPFDSGRWRWDRRRPIRACCAWTGPWRIGSCRRRT
mmetsp:Transcript_60131/g.178297  ORF Transcript_60131/g.178297 Transcript_60131/m.178297 type:complete len:341 (+) Transcript_60131:194-1216(+)